MKFRFTKTIGQTQFTFEDECKDHQEFFEKASFFSSLPSVGPNGETDLVITHRTTKKGDYFSIRSNKADKEFLLGQYKDKKGSLFPKKWEPIFHGGEVEESPFERSQEPPKPKARF